MGERVERGWRFGLRGGLEREMTVVLLSQLCHLCQFLVVLTGELYLTSGASEAGLLLSPQSLYQPRFSVTFKL